MVWKDATDNSGTVKLHLVGLDLDVFKQKSNAKTPAGLVLTHAKRFREAQNFEYAFVFQELYKQLKALETSEKFRAEQWRGKSGVDFIIKPDYVIAIRFQKGDKDEEPKETRRELTKEEINVVIWAIGKLDRNDWIKTSDIAEKVYHMSWKQIFSNRYKHKNLVEIFNFLEYRGWIEYSRKGRLRVKEKMELQENLQWA